jgi:hypothetical protein
MNIITASTTRFYIKSGGAKSLERCTPCPFLKNSAACSLADNLLSGSMLLFPQATKL